MYTTFPSKTYAGGVWRKGFYVITFAVLLLRRPGVCCNAMSPCLHHVLFVCPVALCSEGSVNVIVRVRGGQRQALNLCHTP